MLFFFFFYKNNSSVNIFCIPVTPSQFLLFWDETQVKKVLCSGLRSVNYPRFHKSSPSGVARNWFLLFLDLRSTQWKPIKIVGAHWGSKHFTAKISSLHFLRLTGLKKSSQGVCDQKSSLRLNRVYQDSKSSLKGSGSKRLIGADLLQKLLSRFGSLCMHPSNVYG